MRVKVTVEFEIELDPESYDEADQNDIARMIEVEQNNARDMGLGDYLPILLDLHYDQTGEDATVEFTPL